MLPIVDWLVELDVVVVDGVVVLVVTADVVGTLLLLTLDTIIMTSPGPLMTTPQVDISKFYASNILI